VLQGLRFHGADVATVRGQFQLIDSGGAPTSVGQFRLTLQRNGGKWLVNELQDYAVEAVEPEDNRDRLQQLEWLVGDWVEESPDARLMTQVRWDDSHNFLVRTYELQLAGAPATTGTQIIGWDPRIGQIRSWNFDSKGGFGGGVWQSQGDRWLVKSTGVMRDGRGTTATQIIEKVNNDSFRFSSYDRTAGDETLDDVSGVLIVRKAPDPAAANAEKPAAPR
jgi:hypothetical protein